MTYLGLDFYTIMYILRFFKSTTINGYRWINSKGFLTKNYSIAQCIDGVKPLDKKEYA